MEDSAMRRESRKVTLGSMIIGGGSPVTVQSMTNTDTLDFAKTLEQVRTLENEGCDIVRIAVPTSDSASVFSYLKNSGVKLPLVADIHFDYKIALAAVSAGADKIRINPGNIGESWKVKEVADACRNSGLPIRIGVNSGSVEKKLLEKYGSPTAEALAESALSEAETLESFGFSDIVLSIKSSDVITMVEATRIVASRCEYPLHLGVTEAGPAYDGIIKNCAGIGALLCEGIGDTVRVSLTADPVEEVRAGKKLLSVLGLSRRGGINVISCPTCGRTKIPLISISEEYRDRIKDLDTKGKSITVAIMGCAVNGPGEAREADFGIAGGDGFGVLFRRGEICEKIDESLLCDRLFEETVKYIKGTD